MTTLNIRCGTCRKAVHPTSGLLWADLTDLPKPPDVAPARWRIAHYECAPEMGASAYSIELTRAATYSELLWWTAHLSEKSWLEDTTWMSCMQLTAETGVMDFGPGWADLGSLSTDVGGDLPW